MKIDQAQTAQTLKPHAQDPDDESELRYEIKLVCAPHMLAQARSWVRLHPAGFVVAYPPRRVNSLYLDTLQLSSLNDNLEGLSERRKLRLRWYGDRSTDVRPALELKHKRNLVGRKKRYVLPRSLDLTLPWAQILGRVRADAVRANVGEEWLAMLQTVTQPTLINCYQREYYVTRDGAVRVTLDFAQLAYDQRLSYRPNLRVQLPVADAVVIEIKGGLEQVERLQSIAARFPIPRTRHSKYARGLLAALG